MSESGQPEVAAEVAGSPAEGSGAAESRGSEAGGDIAADGSAVQPGHSDQEGGSDGEASDSEEEPVAFDFEALEQAQRSAAVGGACGSKGADAVAAGSGPKRERGKKQRGGNKETKRRKKKQKREDDLLRAKKAGLHVPSLKEALAAVAVAAKAKAEAMATAAASAAVSSASAASTAPAEPAAAAAAVARAAVSVATQPSASSSASPFVSPFVPQTTGSPAAQTAPGTSATPGAASSTALPARPPVVPTAQTQLLRQMHSYADAVETGSSSSAPAPSVPADPVMMERVVKDAVRHARAVEALSAQRVFVTNVPFKATEQELKEILGKGGTVQSLRLAEDRSTKKFLGYAHATFDSTAAAKAALQQCDRHELHGREVRVAEVKKGEKFQFDLPKEIQEDLKSLMREAYEGKNLSTIKDAWQKRNKGKKLDTTRWGFKNFSSAVKSLDGVVLETHADKHLTNLAFFDTSPAHTAFVKAKAVIVKEREERQAKEKLEKEAKEKLEKEEQAKGEKRRTEQNGDGAEEEGPPKKAPHLEAAADTTAAAGAEATPAVNGVAAPPAAGAASPEVAETKCTPMEIAEGAGVAQEPSAAAPLAAGVGAAPVADPLAAGGPASAEVGAAARGSGTCTAAV